jgi:hypothetical protein
LSIFFHFIVKALLIDFDHSGLLVKFDSKNAQPTRVAYSDSRLPSSNLTSPSSLKPGDDCEVLPEQASGDSTTNNNNEPSGWYPATVKMMKGEFFVVEYKLKNDLKHNDIISSDRIRAPNRNPTLQQNFLHKIVFPVPDDLKELYRSENPSKDFRKVCGALNVHYDENLNTLSVIVSLK